MKKPKKKKAQLKSDELTLAKAVGMMSKTMAGKSPKELQQVWTLYEKEFSKLHIFGKKPMKASPNSSANLVVSIDCLHRALAGTVVYQPLDRKRVLQLVDRKQTMPFQASLQHLYVMPIKGVPEVRPEDYTDVPHDAYEYFKEQPSWNDINSQTHYVIIGGQHCVAVHKLLIEEGSLFEEDERDAQSFIVTIVWSHPREWNLLTYYSRVLNQDLAGVRSEGNYLTLLGLVRKS